MEFGVASVAVITALVYLLGLAVKGTDLDSRWIPAICGGAGVVLGLAAYFTGMPDFPAEDVLTAAAVGAVSGLAATGADQAARALRK